MFIARQPIFDKSMKIYGYELLYRADVHAEEFRDTSATSATASVFGCLFEQGMSQIVGNAKAFVNFDYDFIMSDTIELVPSDSLVIEVLETVKVDDYLMKRLKYLKGKGYKIALDDYDKSIFYPIVPIADIVKFDIINTPLDTIRYDVGQAISHNKIVLAEKVETEDEFHKAADMGFHLFQGFFFSKPKIIAKSDVKNYSTAQYYRILQELNEEEPSFNKIASIIVSDVNLSYRLLRAMSNKGRKDTFNSVKLALQYMGLIELERWIHVLMLQAISKDKPLELMRMSLVRAKFGEYIAIHSKFRNRKDEVYTMCLFSVLDAMLDQTMDEALKNILISDDIYDSLVYQKGDLAPILKLIILYEQGNWIDVNKYTDIIGIDPNKLLQGYLNAVQWAADVLVTF